MSCNCCTGCAGRHLGCHSECEKYKEWKQHREEVKEHIKREMSYHDDVMGVLFKGNRRKK